jgi:hypothetical protein
VVSPGPGTPRSTTRPPASGGGPSQGPRNGAGLQKRKGHIKYMEIFFYFQINFL